ncbi:MAG: septum formation protein Maf [Clostridium sp.]|nr:septum formation protein Maf [Clostridium sp.]
MKDGRTLILASASPRRRELLGQMGLEFLVVPSGADEHVTETDPERRVELLAERKAEEVYERIRKERPDIRPVVIGSDTLVAVDGKILGKPADREEAVAMIGLLEGRHHHVSTGVSIFWEEDGETRGETFCSTTQVEVYPMTREDIEAYADTDEPYDKAGGYGIQGKFCVWVKGIAGDYDTVVGLPAAALYQRLRKLGLL